MAIKRHTDILDITVDSSVISHTREGGNKTEVIDLGTSAITPFFILGRLTTTGAIAKYQDQLTDQEPYAVMESYNAETKECKLLKNCVAVLDKLTMLNQAGDTEILCNPTNLTGTKLSGLDLALRKINIDTI